MNDFSNEIWAYALKNAIEYGKADIAKVLPKLFQHGLDKKDIKSVMQKIQEIVKKVNSLKKEEKEKEFEKYSKYAKEKEEKERTLPELPEISKNMVFRMAPFPSGALHIGNAKTFLLNALYAKKYDGKLILVMDDTIGSEEKQPMLESYSLIEDAFKWLNVEYSKPIVYKSDRLEIYYEYAEKLIEKDKAYVCHCPQEVLRKNREEGRECEHRRLSITRQKDEWKKIFKAKPGSCVLRIKTDMRNANPAFRDRVLFKISDRAHPRIGKKYRVWPTLEMSWAIDDHLLGITHILRGNDLMIETEMEKYIWDIFGWKHPVTIHTGLIKIEGIENKISKSKAQKEVKSGKFSGWDDPRTWSIQSLARRGIKREAILEFIEEIGLNKQDITVPIDTLYSINRKLIDADANRYYFVPDAVQISVKNDPVLMKVDIPMHPDKPESTKEVRLTSGAVYLSKKDYTTYKGKEIRLLHLYNIKLDSKLKKSVFTSSENKNIPKVTWANFNFAQEAKVLMPDGKWIEGLADDGILNLKIGEMIQYERFGFVRFDGIKSEGKNNSIYEFWFAHK